LRPKASIVAKEGRRTPATDAKASSGDKNAPRMDQPFDHWLHKQLHEMYDAIAKEPLPDDLMRLIDQDADKGRVAAKPAPDRADKKKL
jgi:hypothetical protein